MADPYPPPNYGQQDPYAQQPYAQQPAAAPAPASQPIIINNAMQQQQGGGGTVIGRLDGLLPLLLCCIVKVKHPLAGCARVVLYCAVFAALFSDSKQNAVACTKVPEFNIL